MTGQLSLFEFFPQKEINSKNKSLGEPCMYCDVEWCSLVCFLRRGYMWDEVNRFIKGDNGKPLRKSAESRECKK